MEMVACRGLSSPSLIPLKIGVLDLGLYQQKFGKNQTLGVQHPKNADTEWSIPVPVMDVLKDGCAQFKGIECIPEIPKGRLLLCLFFNFHVQI